jgi:HK97 family phage major capsid protein
MGIMSTLTSDIASESDRIKKFEAMEKSAGAIVPAAKKVPTAPSFEKGAAKDGFLKAVITMSKAVADNIGLDAAAEKMYKGDKLAPVFTKAATTVGTTGVPEWAGNLVQEGYASYLEDLLADTIFGRVDGLKLIFGKNGSLTIPYRNGVGSLAGSFVAEGDPIPVKTDNYATVKVSPFKMGVISTFTKELMRKSTPTIEGLVRSHMISDTREVIDAAFLDAAAETAIRPAGLESSAGVGNIVPSTGSTVADIEADIQGVFDRFSAARLGGSGVMIMHPSRKRGLNFKTNSLGQYVFRDQNLLEGFTIITSINVPDDKVYFVDAKALVFGTDAGVEFDVSTQTTLVMGDPAEPINDGSAATTLPTRSLFQTDTIAIKQTLGITWKQVRDAGVQILTNVAW